MTEHLTCPTPLTRIVTDKEHSDSEITSDDESAGKPNAPEHKYLNLLHLPSSPLQTNNQTLTPITEPYSSTSLSTLTEPYSSISVNIPTTEPNSSTILTEPNGSNPPTFNSQIEPYSSSLVTEPNSSNSSTLNFHTEPYSSNSTSEPYSSTNPATKDNAHEHIASAHQQPVDIPSLPMIGAKNKAETLKIEIKSDPTLKTIRGLAHHNKNGYVWDSGLIYHLSLDHTLGERKRLVILQTQRKSLVEMAHDKSGHFSVTKTRAILNHKFTWPNMASDVNTYIMACTKCKEFNKTAHKQAPYHTRPVITEPHQEIALDIIGPLPRSKQGHRFALTTICMASQWPEVYSLHIYRQKVLPMH